MKKNKINLKPLSVNEAFKGRRFKTPKYKRFEKDLLMLLPPLKIDFKAPLRVDITFGFSNTNSDIDNCLKAFLDVLQKKYGSNDRNIYQLNVKKEITIKGSESITFKITEL